MGRDKPCPYKCDWLQIETETMPPQLSLSNKVFVIIGGTSGLGRSAALACVQAGGKVVIVGRDEAKIADTLKEIGEGAEAVQGDASDPQVAARAVQQAVDSFGAFDGLYHVAGGSGRRFGDGPLHEITDEGWAKTLDLNLSSLFYSNRAAAQELLKSGKSGSILNMGSVLGSYPSPEYFTTHAYATSKAAIVGLTRSAASYYASDGIRFNVIAPALVETPMAQRAVQNDEITQFIQSKQPLDGGRVGVPQDLDAAVVFFLSEASHFVTGQVLHVDGGWNVSEGRPTDWKKR